MLLSIMAVPIYIPTSSRLFGLFLYIELYELFINFGCLHAKLLWSCPTL